MSSTMAVVAAFGNPAMLLAHVRVVLDSPICLQATCQPRKWGIFTQKYTVRGSHCMHGWMYVCNHPIAVSVACCPAHQKLCVAGALVSIPAAQLRPSPANATGARPTPHQCLPERWQWRSPSRRRKRTPWQLWIDVELHGRCSGRTPSIITHGGCLSQTF